MSFHIEHDLNKVVFDKHNKGHFLFGAIATACLLFPWWLAILLLTLWEIGDGFKPYYTEFKPTGNKLRDWFVSNCLYSNYFSLQDFFIWNVAGFGWGILARTLIERIVS